MFAAHQATTEKEDETTAIEKEVDAAIDALEATSIGADGVGAVIYRSNSMTDLREKDTLTELGVDTRGATNKPSLSRHEAPAYMTNGESRIREVSTPKSSILLVERRDRQFAL